MEFKSLILIEKDMESNEFIREMDSYELGEGAMYIEKFYYDGSFVNIVFNIDEDMEDWKYNSILDYFNTEVFEKYTCSIEEVEGEYNPTWIIKFKYTDDFDLMSEKLEDICEEIYNQIKIVMEFVEKNRDQLI
ncbi:hypothetical protein K144313037_03490 [Clostridium tetani]|uniref:Uncharacterized protein n=1 Tax=Clostridium tetani TaxID=1513 RepID=A0A4Q0V9D8_CLOTA|nr:DUF6762 family protein [Clostridium tetani]AVP55347.1 hypothetical protein C3B72_09415 [Clostridium tetani]RXI45735.1 hypothetical protein DP130_11825 [Clostridium tetani]RXI62608.1 hypothetical protein DP123_10890 [Clostridium tetani]RXI77317.1 hypothetical protein DP128_04000 [Clostridium tetani]WFN62358.1 hypothetical protein PAA20_02605 [Clostridium tetani]